MVVRVGRRVLAERRIAGRSFDFLAPLPRGELTLRVTAGRRIFKVAHVVGLPAGARPRAAASWLEPALQARVRALLHGVSGPSAVYVENVGSGAGAASNARARFPAASTLKVAIAIAVLRTLDGKPAPGSWLDGLLHRMLVDSSNDAANDLELHLGGSTSGGGAAVDDLLRRLGLVDSEMYGGYERDPHGHRPIPIRNEDEPALGGKYTTAFDLARLYIDVHLASDGKGVLAQRLRGEFTPSDARYLLYLLSLVPDRGKLGRYLGRQPVVLMHKAGWISTARHDAGLVYYPGGVFVAAVMTSQSGDEADVLAGRVAVTALARFRRLLRVQPPA